MLNQQVQPNSTKALISLNQPVFKIKSSTKPLVRIRSLPAVRSLKVSSMATTSTSQEIILADRSEQQNLMGIRAVVTVKQSDGLFQRLGFDRALHYLGKTLLLQLVSTEHDLMARPEKDAIKGHVRRIGEEEDDHVKYEAEFQVPSGFGEVGAVLVQNEHFKEMYLKDIVLHGFPHGPMIVTCNSYVQPKHVDPKKRVFFTNKSYLPVQTPSGLKSLREEELMNVRGNGTGERESFERIYDYAVYNDIGNPDSSEELTRPTLGGSKEHPYPRRCRTGRSPSEKDPSAEKRSSSIYIPRDQEFSEIKQQTFISKTVNSVLPAVLPILESALIDTDRSFPYFSAIDNLFNEVGFKVPSTTSQGFFRSLLRLFGALTDTVEDVIQFDTPNTMDRDKFFWFRDEEFARQTLAGLNPYSIQLVTEWPIKSKLDPKIYGPPESAISEELIERELGGLMAVDKAIRQKKLFIIDYHDLLLPYVNKVRQIKGTTLYGSRALFFLKSDDTLKPLAIELTRPQSEDKPQWKQVYTPRPDSTGNWLWRLAKAHFLAHDSAHHELISHWLRTHCAVEPYIIATNRQLSSMHPIYRLLHPHWRYTMRINALARQVLISAGGIIETSFSLKKYCMELSSVAYDQQWRFNLQALPADLISRGMAVEDPTSPHGLKLTIKDYPFANDGLLMWDAIKRWVSDYVTHYYPTPSLIDADRELQAWWTEIRTEGHGDKKNELGWPNLKTPNDLIDIITTMIWSASCHHAAVNFGQYAYAGYFPNRPTIARTKMPNEDPSDQEWKIFLEKPEDVLMQCFPSQIQATIVMAVLGIISTHSPDEEYIGGQIEESWAQSPDIKAAFERFSERIREIERIIDERNVNDNLRNRSGAGILPYEFLKPFSGPGVTGKGVPNSTSI